MIIVKIATGILLEKIEIMSIMKFKKFEDLDKFEKEGKGINWHFAPDKIYLKKTLKFHIPSLFPSGVYKFKTFEKAEKWGREWCIKSGVTRRTR